MFLYRDHMGMLRESMKTLQEMKDFSELEVYLHKSFGPGEITVKPYVYDDRIDWETHIVCHKGRAVGFTDRLVDDTNSDQSDPKLTWIEIDG